MNRVLIADDVSEQAVDILKQYGLEVDYQPKVPQAGLAAAVKGFHGLVVRSRVTVGADVIEAGDLLKIVGRAGVGVDNIDVEAATRKGVIVMNTPMGNVTSAAEHTFALILASARNIARAHAALSAGSWERKGFTGVELEGKTLGIVGLGKVGARVARYARAFGMEVIAFDPHITRDRADQIGVHLVPMEQLVAQSDVISLHTVLNDQTRNLFGADLLKKMKPGARLVNTSRGGVIDEPALAAALEAGTIAGAGLDVFDQEPPDPKLALLKNPKATLTPHLGASTEEARLKVAVDIAHQFGEFFKSGIARNAVNIPSLPDPALQPYLRLAEDLGSLCRQLTRGRVEAIEVSYQGELAKAETGAITPAVLKGFLDPVYGKSVTVVNAAHKVQERGIRVAETRAAVTKGFTSLLSVKLTSDEGTRRVSGTVLEDRGPRIVAIDDYRIDLKPSRYMLLSFYPDRPGMVGRIGMLLGDRSINIARMEVGRLGKGKQAVMIMTVDDPIPEAVVEAIGKALQIDVVHAVTLPG